MRRLLPVLMGMIVLLLAVSAAFALCLTDDEITSPTDLMHEENIVEAMVDEVSVGNNKVEFTISPLEVFRGKEISRYVLNTRGFLCSPRRNYRDLKGKKVVFLGAQGELMCTDDIIEIENFDKPDLLRGFLRCLNPASELAAILERDRKYLNNLPARWCNSRERGWTYGTRGAPKLDGRCRSEDPRLSWFEEKMEEGFLDRTEMAVMMLCPNPRSIK